MLLVRVGKYFAGFECKMNGGNLFLISFAVKTLCLGLTFVLANY